MVALGFQSGLPLALSGFTLRQWLTEQNVPLETIGLTASIGLSYTLKFLWSPVLDGVRPPFFGRRRGWLLTVQPLLVLAVVALAISDGAWAIGAAAVVAFLSATQDIAIDAWRIEIFPQSQQGLATAAYVWGYRIAMLVSGGGTIWSAGYLGWHGALLVVALLLAFGFVTILLAPEPPPVRVVAGQGIFRAVRAPLLDFLLRPGAWVILAFVALFYLGEAMAGVMLAPFYRSLGFDRAMVAAASSLPSLGATMAGIGVGGLIVVRIGLQRALISTGFLQMGAMTLYVLLSLTHENWPLLFGTVVVEAFVQGLASAAFLAYLSGLCRPAYAATQFALLSSVAPVASHTVGAFSGFLAAATGWTGFYTLAMLASLPAMMMMLYILSRYPPVASKSSAVLF